MKKITLLLLLALTFGACGDDDPVTPETTIIGEWHLESLNDNTQTNYNIAGITSEQTLVITSADENLIMDIKEDSTFTTVGSYVTYSQGTTNGQEVVTDTTTLDFDEEGTWMMVDNQLTLLYDNGEPEPYIIQSLTNNELTLGINIDTTFTLAGTTTHAVSTTTIKFTK